MNKVSNIIMMCFAVMIGGVIYWALHVSDSKTVVNTIVVPTGNELAPFEERVEGLVILCKKSQGQLYIDESRKDERIGCLFLPAIQNGKERSVTKE